LDIKKALYDKLKVIGGFFIFKRTTQFVKSKSYTKP